MKYKYSHFGTPCSHCYFIKLAFSTLFDQRNLLFKIINPTLFLKIAPQIYHVLTLTLFKVGTSQDQIKGLI